MKIRGLFCSVIMLSAVACSKMSDNKPQLDLVYSNDTYQLTGVAITNTNRVFTNYPLWSDVYRYAVTEINGKTTETAYPNTEMNSWNPGQDGLSKWVCVQAVVAGKNNKLWVVDPASPKMQGVYNNSNKLVKIDLTNNTVERVYPVNTAAGPGSYINDVRVDEERGIAYMTNSQEGGIVIVDLNTGNVRQVLQGHYSVLSDPSFTFIIDGKELRKNGQPVKIHSDGIALSPDREWLYYKPLTDDKLYRIRTEFLRDASLTGTALGAKVEDLGRFTTTDGMILDKFGNLYLGDLQHNRIVRITPDMRMKEVISDERLIWPDSYSISEDGYLYISCSQINKQPEYNEGVNKRTSPYTIFRINIL
ncbi:SMP-30/gluconolactonase/LRE family protein [Sediminibacterium ginsengisoli]|uniref:Major royal jelly protein n=1 Tax=Sediminibacterium ginsengisoli TaxID=413434 RepID=A0A1T4LBK7_9BACT|nr:major royal jelly family protein [Sediminibacterium ginsengisoli]SJZ51884.1 Major royal jelly protein [Sediminibacterium ginsengisoli]